MKLEELAKGIGAHQLTPGAGIHDIRHIYAGDRMSDLLGAVGGETLLVTHIANQGLLRLIELMDAAALCFVNGVYPDDILVEAAGDSGTALLVSPYDMYETCGRIYLLLNAAPSDNPSP